MKLKSYIHEKMKKLKMLLRRKKSKCCYLFLDNSNIGRIVSNGASILAILEADVTRFSPSSSPGVSNLPVGGGVDSDSLHAVIDRLAAGRDNSTSVGVEVRGIQADRERTFGLDVGGHVGLTGDGVVGGDSDSELSGVRSASACGSVVG